MAFLLRFVTMLALGPPPSDAGADVPAIPLDGPASDERLEVIEGSSTDESSSDGASDETFRRHRFVPLPDIRRDPGTGTMLGVRGSYVYRDIDSGGINKAQVDLALRFSVKGVQQHTLEVLLRDLLHQQEIFTLDGEWTQDPIFPWFGLGNDNVVDDDQGTRRLHWVRRFSVGPSAMYRHPIVRLPAMAGPWPRGEAYLRLAGGYRFRYDRFRPYPRTVFAEDFGEDEQISRRGSVVTGLEWDSRDNVWSPSAGSLHDVTYEVGGPWAGGTTTWSRFSAATRLYRSLGTRKVILAHLARFDTAFGDVPLATMGELGGVRVRRGFGGMFMLRGYLRERFIGRQKAYTSAELRIEPFDWRVKGRRLSPAFKGFVDAGKVFQPHHDRLTDEVHVSGGAGFYLVWDEFFVIRVDAGFSEEGHGVYVTSGHAF